MTHSSGTIRQSATVIRVDATQIEVEVCRPEACAACKAKSVCSEGGGQGKRMTLANDGQGYQLGEQITLVMRRSAGLKAVVIAYLVPVILVVAALLVFQTVQIKETVAAISTLVLLGLYFLVIRLLRCRLNRELTIEIEKEIGQ
ncbi:SoxR reducing system RseC family protein [Millionella massiliensis]|uniref:SoxR reducing system RseC family protein n=1 Tax=Millionella massiliensis TaxID=1871023 RepID=UPI0008DB1FD2|nr:SoxR reducing system RseC family protein [Millionella massiliensis]